MTVNDKLNILLVDDQRSKLLTYETILQPLGENLLLATSASDALECLLRNEIAVVLVDVCMPDLDGYQLATMIHDHPRHQKTSIIFVSAILMTDLDRLRGYECGAVDYVPVPVVPEILRAKVSVFAELYRKTRQLERMNIELEERVLARTAQLEASTTRLLENEEHLRDVDKRKDVFLAMLAHELRNPLAPILNAVHALAIKELPEAHHVRAREIIERQVDHMVRLIDDLMDVSRISRDLITLEDEPVDLGVVIARAVETARPAIDAKRHKFDMSLPDEPLALRGDETRLSQAIANLLDNAAKFTEPGGSIRLLVSVVGHHVTISVKDSGIGIGAEHVPKLFELFTQVDQRLDRPQTGLGIGLALVRRLVEMHGGQVMAHSNGVGHGSEFIIRLPVVAGIDEALSSHETRASDFAPPSSRRRILVADDNRDAAESLTLLLQVAGHDVRTTYDGREALAVTEAFRPEVLLLDLGMPNLDGCQTAERIRQQPAGKDMILIALTGWGQEKDRDRTAAAGFDAHLIKPVNAADLLEIISNMGSMRATATLETPQMTKADV